jgi:hypothetical protein
MRSIARRIHKLEDRFGIVNPKPSYLLTLHCAGVNLPPEIHSACVEVLEEEGLLCPGCFTLADFTKIPSGLSLEDTRRFVLAHLGEICT